MTTRIDSALITKAPGVCGGDACVRNTRIPVWLLVSYRREGTGDDKLLEAYPDLAPANLKAAWEYYENNGSEIDANIAAQENA